MILRTPQELDQNHAQGTDSKTPQCLDIVYQQTEDISVTPQELDQKSAQSKGTKTPQCMSKL